MQADLSQLPEETEALALPYEAAKLNDSSELSNFDLPKIPVAIPTHNTEIMWDVTIFRSSNLRRLNGSKYNLLNRSSCVAVMPDESSPSPESDYALFLDSLKQRIRTAQVKAALAVNRELILLYWQIGCEILARQEEEGWGTKVIERLAKDLKREFPDIKGFSRTNLLYMQSFAKAYPDEQIVHQTGGQIPWKHNCVLLDKVKDPQQRFWYIQKTVENGWSRDILVMQIETGLFQRQGGAITNIVEAFDNLLCINSPHLSLDAETFLMLLHSKLKI